nr:hypothetical protein [Lachnospiraceae bacterium]
MYFDITYFDEKYEPQSIQLICDKCGEYIEVNYDNEYISRAQSEYCFVTDGSKIICKCGNECQNGLIEPKKNQKIVYTQQTSPILNKPKCPTCSSTNVQKIGTGERMASVAMLGMFSKKINKSFKCKNCGYT